MYKLTSIIVTGIISYKDTYLIIKRSFDDETEPGTWEFPGGNIEEDECVSEALKRELYEETQLCVSVRGIAYAVVFDRSSDKRSVLLCYHCIADTDVVTLSAEHDDYLWATKDELLYVLHPEIVNDLKTQGVLKIL